MTSTAALHRFATAAAALLSVLPPAGVHAAASAAPGAQPCGETAVNVTAAINAIRKLPEVREIDRQASRRGLPLAFAHHREGVRVAGQCRLSISVYVDHPDRWERRETFLVNRRSGVTHVLNLDGDYVTLHRWRAGSH